MMGVVVSDGYMSFGGYQTYWRVAGDLRESVAQGMAPLLALHGGPGSTHAYLEILDELVDRTGRAVVTYDQLGCGESYVEGHPELWVKETWVDELAAVREALGLSDIHMLGQSWGGMLEISYVVDRQPAGVRSIVLSSTLSSSQLWGREQHRMARQLPSDEWAALEEAERTENYGATAYLQAIDHYMALHCADVTYGADAPECLRRPRKSGKESYEVAWGPNELMPQGTLATWDYTDRLPEVDQSCLVISGTDDLCTPLIAKTMYDHLPDARWELFEGCRHMCFVDDTPRYIELLATWLAEHDG